MWAGIGSGRDMRVILVVDVLYLNSIIIIAYEK